MVHFLGNIEDDLNRLGMEHVQCVADLKKQPQFLHPLQ